MIAAATLLSLLLVAPPEAHSTETSTEGPVGVPGVVIDHQPASSGQYVGSPSLAVLPDGSYVASHDIFGPKSREHERSITRVFASRDRGRSWKPLSTIRGQFWSTLFVHDEALYILGTWKHHGNLIIRRSRDGGRTWTEPRDTTSGLLAEGEYHTAPVPLLVHDGRLWRAFEDAGGGTRWGERYRACVMSMPLDADPLLRDSWIFSNILAGNPGWVDGSFGGWLEGNTVVDPDGRMVNILRVDVPAPEEKAAVVRVAEDGRRISFDPKTGFIAFPGGAKKFTIRYDPLSKHYWSLASIIPPDYREERPGRVRNTLALTRSKNLRSWEVRCILVHHPDVKKHGYQYPDWLFEGDDLIAVVRTAHDDGLGGAHNNHDANFLTFHRIEGFRALTLASSVVDPVALGMATSESSESRHGDKPQGTVLHVSHEGDDGASGGAADPLRTLEGARDRIRTLRRVEKIDGPVTVKVSPGSQELHRPFSLGPEDSGSREAPVTYVAASSRQARLLGGRKISFRGPVTDRAVRERLPVIARGSVLVADLREQGIEDFGKLMPRGFGGHGGAALELFYDGRPMQVARYPNRGWLTIAGLPDGKDGDVIQYSGERPARWLGAPDAWLFGYWFHGWADQFLPVSAIDPERSQIRLGVRHGYGFREGQRFFALNLLEELDEPGEWYLDREKGHLYFWPPDTRGDGEALVSLLAGAIVEIRGVSHVRFEGLVLEASRDTGVIVDGGEGVTLSDCAIRNVGGSAIRVRGGRQHRVISCDIAWTGEGGISLEGGDRRTLEPARHEAVDNHIHHFGCTRRTYQPAVRLSGVGMRVAHNLLHDAPHMAIGFGGNDHVIEFNEIHHVLTETDDAGALYMGRDWTTRGHLIRHNFIHHSGNQHATPIPESERTEPHVVYEPLHRHGTNLLYFDDAACGIEVYGNVLHDGGRAVMIGGGRDHDVRNNLILGGNIGIWIDARGVGWARDHIRRGGGWRMYRKLQDVGFNRPPYSEKYPALARILEDHPHEPRGNRVIGNVLVGVKEWRHLQGAKEEWITFERNLAVEGPSESPTEALRAIPEEKLERIGFEPIPFERIGLLRKGGSE